MKLLSVYLAKSKSDYILQLHCNCRMHLSISISYSVIPTTQTHWHLTRVLLIEFVTDRVSKSLKGTY